MLKSAKRAILPGVIALCVLLCGCSQSQQVESQAFVLALGVDLGEDGLVLSARMPRIAGKSAEEGGSGGGSDYLNISASAYDYESALDALACVTPRSVNLSQLKIIAFSETVAASSVFRTLIEEIEQTERLFPAARVVICKGSAADFVNSLEPAFGTRLSKAIAATFDYFESIGTVPASSLADLCARTESFYSDPMTAYAQTGMPENVQSDIPVAYTGAALFANGRMTGSFDDEESRIAALLTGSTNSIRYVFDGSLVRLTQLAAPSVTIDTNSDPLMIRVSFNLAISTQKNGIDPRQLADRFAADVRSAIKHAQDIGTEPFGFTEVAAAHFRTIPEFSAYEFKRRYTRAKVEIHVILISF